ncbi:MAG: nuclear transport factor 2 family protein [Patescibacteria group bacterium]|nr:nuclear transport factor 2 family protein [Patescibacteria group bacterium]MDE1988306.1 nuclear transport factor 2 family protein [Patescibacteria group bacterium]MDE2218658.1 nuclear transport factor 2 family protein [Patescibacteria group bacterium]
MKRDEAKKLIDIYGEAWVKQDPDLILTVFTLDAIYNDPKEPESLGHNGIKSYWIKKVVGEQKDIKFKLLNLWIDKDEVIAEWDAEFIDTKRNLLIKMREVGIFTIRDGKFSSLREYYKTIKTPL